MAPRKQYRRHDPDEENPPASLATIDGYVRLATAVCNQALLELVDPDPRKWLDAALWMLAPGTSAGLFFGLAMDAEPRHLARKIKFKRLKQVRRKELIGND